MNRSRVGRALVFGGTGLVGRYLVPTLVQLGYEVDIVSRVLRPPQDRICYLRADLANAGWLEDAGFDLGSYDVIYYMAYSIHHDRGTNRQVTVGALASLIDALRVLPSSRLRHVVYVGSMVVFDSTPTFGVITEDSPRAATSDYPKDKLAAVQQIYRIPENIYGTILHPTGIYDASSPRIRRYQRLLEYNFVPQSVPLGINNIVHARDVANALVLCLGRPLNNRVEEYIINGESIAALDWFRVLESSVKKKCLFTLPSYFRYVCRGSVRTILNRLYVGCPIYFDKSAHSPIVQHLVYAGDKAQRDFGYVPEIKFSEALGGAYKNPGHQNLFMLANKTVASLQRRYGSVVDYVRYRRRFLRCFPDIPASRGEKSGERVLFVAGRGMNIAWAQMWTYLSVAFLRRGIVPSVILFRRQKILQLYFRLVGARMYWMDDVLKATPCAFDLSCIDRCTTVDQWKALKYGSMPVGEMILSTYCRYSATGYIDPLSPALKNFATEWLPNICKAYDAAKLLYEKEHIKHVVSSEIFSEEYGGFYFAAIDSEIDVIRTSGTVRDNAIVVQRRNKENARLHHASLSKAAWNTVKELPDYDVIKAAVDANFQSRYSNKWYRSARNHKNTQIVSREEGRGQLGIAMDSKVAVIYSHILYDALFHYGDELFQDYATWLVETIKIAMRNPNLQWFVKLHPSNIWRGEFQSLLGGRYEEERIIEQRIGALPEHIRLIYADSKISPLGWYHVADYGISVRGTAGLEMACLGKPVITAGTGRYEGRGFTLDPATITEYERMILNLHNIPPLSDAQVMLANRFAHGLFNLKPYELTGLEVCVGCGKKEVRASDDIIYLPYPRTPGEGGGMPDDLQRFDSFVNDASQQDLLRQA